MNAFLITPEREEWFQRELDRVERKRAADAGIFLDRQIVKELRYVLGCPRPPAGRVIPEEVAIRISAQARTIRINGGTA